MPDTPLDLDAIRTRAERQAVAYARMLELNGGCGLLGVRHPVMFVDMRAWDDSTENDHADTVLALITEVERLRAEVARLREEAARPAPWRDEEAVVEAVARAMFPHYFTDDRQPLRVFTETRSDAELRGAEREAARHRARQALAVVCEHLPVKPDRETLARALRAAGLVEVVAVHEGYGAEEVVHSHLRPAVDAVLTLLPGRTEAEVKAEAWDECYGTDEECGMPRTNPYRKETDRG